MSKEEEKQTIRKSKRLLKLIYLYLDQDIIYIFPKFTTGQKYRERTNPTIQMLPRAQSGPPRNRGKLLFPDNEPQSYHVVESAALHSFTSYMILRSIGLTNKTWTQKLPQ
jgi:hypothetical protein